MPNQGRRTLKEFARRRMQRPLLDPLDKVNACPNHCHDFGHLIFSTKNRFSFLSDRQIRIDMHAYLATILRSHDCETLIVGGTNDHVHALFDLSRKYSISTIVKEAKRTSSAWIKEVSPSSRKFHWQNGYAAFSVSQSDLDRVCR